MEQPTNNNQPEFEAPAPETLTVQSDSVSEISSDVKSETVPAQADGKVPEAKKMPKKLTYKPSRRATFVGIAVVVAILAANAGLIMFLMQSQASAEGDLNHEGVTLSPQVLDKLGVSRNPVGNSGTTLVVGPDSKFNGKIEVGGDASIGGQLTLNNKLNASEASLSRLEAGNTSIQQLNVNGDGTISTLNLRRDLAVVGVTRLQGPVTMDNLLTVNNSLNVVGNLSVGGTLSVRTFQASSLTSENTLTIGGHIVTRGNAPGVSPGPGVGQNGTASISGNDAAGTVAVGVGAGAQGGILANVSFVSKYSNIPHVVVTAVGPGAGSVYVTRNASGFSIGVNGPIAPGGYAFDYIVMQ